MALDEKDKEWVKKQIKESGSGVGCLWTLAVYLLMWILLGVLRALLDSGIITIERGSYGIPAPVGHPVQLKEEADKK